MDIKRFATIVFKSFVWIAFILMLILFWCGIKEMAEAEQIAPVEVAEVEPVPTQVKEPDVVMLSCTVIKKADTTRSEPEQTYTEEELEMLALVIYQEAGSDVISDETRMMVGNVVLNRVGAPCFPDTLEGVLLQERQYGRLHWTGLVWPERASYLSEAHAVERAYDCAERLLNGERVLPDDVIWQAEFSQGSEIVAHQDGFYFCR